MARSISAAKAKAQLSAIISEVEHGGEHYVIERHGKPVAALVSVQELRDLQAGEFRPARARGALALVGAWSDVGDQEIDDLVEEIYAARSRDTGRPVVLEE
jgi:prevent-host-death family protein